LALNDRFHQQRTFGENWRRTELRTEPPDDDVAKNASPQQASRWFRRGGAAQSPESGH